MGSKIQGFQGSFRFQRFQKFQGFQVSGVSGFRGFKGFKGFRGGDGLAIENIKSIERVWREDGGRKD